jgi:hypothetical protein
MAETVTTGTKPQEFTLWQRDPAKAERMERYVEWLLVPESYREPKSKAKLAEAMGVTPQTLRNYDREPWVQRELTLRGRAIARVQDAPGVLAALRTQAIDPANPRSVAAAKVWLDWHSKQADTGIEEVDLSSLSDEQLYDLALSTIGSRSQEG